MTQSYLIGVWITLLFYLTSILLFDSSSINTTAYLISCVLVVFLFGVCGEKIRLPNFKFRLINLEKYEKLFLIIFVFASFANAVDLFEHFDASDPVAVKNILTEMSADQSREGNIGILIMYLVGFPSVYLAAKRNAEVGLNLYSCLIVLCLVVPSFLSFSRLQLVVNMFIYFYAYVEYKKMGKKEFARSAAKFMIYILAVFLIIMSLRFTGEDGESLVFAVFVYVFGGFSALDVSFNYLVAQDYIGGSTFYGLSSWLLKMGIIDKLPNLHLEFVQIGDSTTNVYTAYRHLIADFGIFGSLVFLAVVSIIGGVSYSNVNRLQYLVPINVLISTYFTLIFYTSAFVDTRVVVGGLFSTFLFMLKK